MQCTVQMYNSTVFTVHVYNSAVYGTGVQQCSLQYTLRAVQYRCSGRYSASGRQSHPAVQYSTPDCKPDCTHCTPYCTHCTVYTCTLQVYSDTSAVNTGHLPAATAFLRLDWTGGESISTATGDCNWLNMELAGTGWNLLELAGIGWSWLEPELSSVEPVQ